MGDSDSTPGELSATPSIRRSKGKPQDSETMEHLAIKPAKANKAQHPERSTQFPSGLMLRKAILAASRQEPPPKKQAQK